MFLHVLTVKGKRKKRVREELPLGFRRLFVFENQDKKTAFVPIRRWKLVITLIILENRAFLRWWKKREKSPLFL
jgi:hypothetical protein